MPQREPLAEKIARKIDKTPGHGPNGDCWIWTAHLNKGGYGYITNPAITSHRAAYQIAYGEIPKGIFVCHTCDNPKCCNPSHLFLGTPKQNTEDMMRKGRNHHQSQTYCQSGHEYTPENTRFRNNGRGRVCTICHNAYMAEYRKLRK